MVLVAFLIKSLSNFYGNILGNLLEPTKVLCMVLQSPFSKKSFCYTFSIARLLFSTDPFFCLNWQFQIRTGRSSRAQSFYRQRSSFGKGKNGNICFHGILARALLLLPHVKSQKFDVCMILGISWSRIVY